jgi:hypothetical protein
LNSPEGIIRQEDLSVPPRVIGTDYILLLQELSGAGGYVSATEDLGFQGSAVPWNGRKGRVAKGKRPVGG